MASPDPGGVAAWDRAHVWHPYTALPGAVPAHVVTGARGVRITLADGRELIDAMSSWWAVVHGYRHPRLDRALTAQLAELPHVMFGGLTHAPAVELARALAGLTGLPKVFLADSGSVAVEVAIKMALQYGRPRGRTRLLALRGAYHGDTFGAMSVCDPVNGMHRVFTGTLPEQVFAPRPPREPSAGYRAELAATVARHAHELAAIIVEPVVQGAGGMWFYHPEHLRALRELADEHDLLLIADEIATGFGRTGEMFGCDHAGVRPDIMCVGKALTGGYLSMGATLCTERVAAGVGVLMHGPTFMGNPLAAAVARASLDLLAERPWREEVKRIEAGLAAGLAPARALPGVADVRVLGAVGVIETETPVDVARAQDAAMDRGVWLRPFGRLIYTMPPYPVTDTEVSAIADAMLAAARAR